jgi:hypothetical protein
VRARLAALLAAPAALLLLSAPHASHPKPHPRPCPAPPLLAVLIPASLDKEPSGPEAASMLASLALEGLCGLRQGKADCLAAAAEDGCAWDGEATVGRGTDLRLICGGGGGGGCSSDERAAGSRALLLIASGGPHALLLCSSACGRRLQPDLSPCALPSPPCALLAPPPAAQTPCAMDPKELARRQAKLEAAAAKLPKAQASELTQRLRICRAAATRSACADLGALCSWRRRAGAGGARRGAGAGGDDTSINFPPASTAGRGRGSGSATADDEAACVPSPTALATALLGPGASGAGTGGTARRTAAPAAGAARLCALLSSQAACGSAGTAEVDLARLRAVASLDFESALQLPAATGLKTLPLGGSGSGRAGGGISLRPSGRPGAGAGGVGLPGAGGGGVGIGGEDAAGTDDDEWGVEPAGAGPAPWSSPSRRAGSGGLGSGGPSASTGGLGSLRPSGGAGRASAPSTGADADLDDDEWGAPSAGGYGRAGGGSGPSGRSPSAPPKPSATGPSSRPVMPVAWPKPAAPGSGEAGDEEAADAGDEWGPDGGAPARRAASPSPKPWAGPSSSGPVMPVAWPRPTAPPARPAGGGDEVVGDDELGLGLGGLSRRASPSPKPSSAPSRYAKPETPASPTSADGGAGPPSTRPGAPSYTPPYAASRRASPSPKPPSSSSRAPPASPLPAGADSSEDEGGDGDAGFGGSPAGAASVPTKEPYMGSRAGGGRRMKL